MSNRSSSNSGIGFVGLLTILFIGLKLTGYIHWSWLWVFSPMWVTLLILVIVFIIALILASLKKK